MTMTQTLVLPERSAVDTGETSVFFIGTATTLIRCAGFTILTDPNFIHRHEQVDIGGGLKATRLTDPALEIHELPPLDFIILSHFHGDHFDQVAERELDRSIPIITPPQAADELRKRGFTNLLPLEPWQSAEVTRGADRLRITATPGRHGPALVSFVLPDVMGSILDFSNGEGRALRMYITGDTMVYDDILEIPRRFPQVDLALLHLGGTRVMGILVTMDDEDGVKMLQTINPREAIPIHYNDYDVFKSPLEDFLQRAAQAGLQDRVHVLRHGETYTFSLGAQQ